MRLSQALPVATESQSLRNTNRSMWAPGAAWGLGRRCFMTPLGQTALQSYLCQQTQSVTSGKRRAQCKRGLSGCSELVIMVQESSAFSEAHIQILQESRIQWEPSKRNFEQGRQEKYTMLLIVPLLQQWGFIPHFFYMFEVFHNKKDSMCIRAHSI